MKVKQALIVWLMIVFLLLPFGSASANPPKFNQAASWKNARSTFSPIRLLSTRDKIQFQEVDEENEDDKVVYLTFDDGPDPDWTPQVLDVLARYHAGATFYMIGRNANTFPELVRQIAEAGQTIAIHGYNHMDMSYIDYQTFYLEVHDSETVILEALGEEFESHFGRCLRPPYGKTSEFLYANANQMDYEVSMWNIDTKDWQQPDPAEMLDSLIKRLEPEKVILMHDGGQEREKTLTGLRLILHELIMQGYHVLPYCTNQGQAIQIP